MQTEITSTYINNFILDIRCISGLQQAYIKLIKLRQINPIIIQPSSLSYNKQHISSNEELRQWHNKQSNYQPWQAINSLIVKQTLSNTLVHWSTQPKLTRKPDFHHISRLQGVQNPPNQAWTIHSFTIIEQHRKFNKATAITNGLSNNQTNQTKPVHWNKTKHRCESVNQP